MRLTTRIGTTLSAAVLAAGGMAAVALPAAHAAPGVRHCGYPPGHCGIYFSQSSYNPGALVNFYSDRAFRPGEWVHGTLNCRGQAGDKTVGPWQANENRRVVGHFRLDKDTPAGTCTLTLVGPNTGNNASSSFDVKKRGQGAISGQSSGGATIAPSSTGTTTSSQGAAVTGATTASAAPSSTGLPFTGGAYTIPMTAAGILLLLGGGSILTMVRRRRRADMSGVA